MVDADETEELFVKTMQEFKFIINKEELIIQKQEEEKIDENKLVMDMK